MSSTAAFGFSLSVALAVTAYDGSGVEDPSWRSCSDESQSAESRNAACTAYIEEQDAKAVAEAYFWRGVARADLRELEAASKDFAEATSRRPDMAAAHIWLGNTLSDLERHEDSYKSLRRALWLEPDNPLAHALVGRHWRRFQQWDKALEHLDRAIELSGRDLHAQSYPRADRCWVRAVVGRGLEDAVNDCNASIASDENNPYFYEARGLVMYRLGRLEEARRDYDRSIELGSAGAESNYMRSLVRRALGDTPGAESDLALAVAEEPKVVERFAGYGIPNSKGSGKGQRGKDSAPKGAEGR